MNDADCFRTQEGCPAAGFTVEPLTELALDRLAPLLEEARQAEFRALARLVEEWASGTNRFDRPGEALFVALDGSRVVGVCGLNIDPFVPGGRMGRVRRLYVLAGYRRRGIGRQLVGQAVARARGRFECLRLRTDSEGAAWFYEALGFRRSDDPGCTHTLDLTGA
jgi:GNAT superfamily N-acetyltransferase